MTGFDPISMGISQGLEMIDGIGAISKGKFDYGQQNYSIQDASNWGSERGKAIGNMFGPLGKIIGGIIGAKKAEKEAKIILDNRQAKMNDLLDFQKEKNKEMGFFTNTNNLNEYE